MLRLFESKATWTAECSISIFFSSFLVCKLKKMFARMLATERSPKIIEEIRSLFELFSIFLLIFCMSAVILRSSGVRSLKIASLMDKLQNCECFLIFLFLLKTQQILWFRKVLFSNAYLGIYQLIFFF